MQRETDMDMSYSKVSGGTHNFISIERSIFGLNMV